MLETSLDIEPSAPNRLLSSSLLLRMPTSSLATCSKIEMTSTRPTGGHSRNSLPRSDWRDRFVLIGPDFVLSTLEPHRSPA